ncbi:Methyltransferase-related protein [Trifolium repens]|nr:Methyltransferase-related protein [Trifolium repens]
MCPLRFILVFFSAVLAGYFAWRTVRSSPNIDLDSDNYIEEEKSSLKKENFDFKKMIQNGFWVFVDMASGRYLWRNLRQTNKDVELKSS